MFLMKYWQYALSFLSYVTETGHEIFTLSPKGLDKPPYG
jgi:hypothetical protein